MPDEPLKSMPLSNPYLTWDVQELEEQWPDWREVADQLGGLPPLDDEDIRSLVMYRERPQVPPWLDDREASITKFGGVALAGPVADASDLDEGWGVIAKPRFASASGLGAGFRLLRGLRRVTHLEIAQPFYAGDHISTDWAIFNGRQVLHVQSEGYPSGTSGRFSHWDVGVSKAAPSLDLPAELSSFSGCINTEHIGGDLIEVHFRPSLEFFPLYGSEVIRCLLDPAYAARTPAPSIRRGTMVVIPRQGAREVRAESLSEHSWRERLVYVKR